MFILRDTIRHLGFAYGTALRMKRNSTAPNTDQLFWCFYMREICSQTTQDLAPRERRILGAGIEHGLGKTPAPAGLFITDELMHFSAEGILP